MVVSIRRSAYLRPMLRLGRSDLDATLRLIASLAETEVAEPDDAAEELEGPYPLAALEGVQALVPCAAVAYQDLNLVARRYEAASWLGPDDEDDLELYWALGGCQISTHREATGDLGAVRISDLIEPRRYRETPIYREYFLPVRMERIIDLGLPAASGRHRSIVLFRETGARDFSERDRAVLELLRPHLLAFEAGATLRRQLHEALARRDSATSTAADTGLTAREREIVLLVAQGKTNAEIAAELWVAPSTVKKHLENVYVKLGVGRRAAAAQLVRAVNQN